MARIYARGRKKWIVRVFMGYDPETGKQITKNQTIVGTKQDAQDWAYEQERLRRLMGTRAVLRGATIGDLLDDLIPDYRVNAKGVEWCEGKVNLRVRPFFGKLKASSLTTDHVRAFIDMRQTAGAKNATINRELALLRRALNLGAEATPPKAQRVPHIPALQENNVRKGFFEHEHYEAILKELPPEVRPVVTFAYHTDCRRGEILMLRWAQVDLIEQAVVLQPGETKNDEGRVIALLPELYEVLAMQRAIRDEKYPDCPWVFFREGQRILDFKDSWATACFKAGVWRGDEETGKPAKLFHDLRRTGVRNLIRAGVPEVVAMRISGHKTRSVVDRYNIVSGADLKDTAQRLHEYHQGTAKKKADAASGTIVTQAAPQRVV
ncbi:MAG: site-specific integrase [Bryobacterales bacterium]|nr:site-specific integrase [Bryobacterales bacterium]